MNVSRRGLILGAAATLAAPALVRAELIMPVRRIIQPLAWIPLDGRKIDRYMYPELYQFTDLYPDRRLPVAPGAYVATRDQPMAPIGSIWYMTASL